MVNRIQTLRSSVPGSVPPPGTRQPGELWITFPDLALGLIDTTQTAQPLLAVRFFSPLTNYAVGDFVVFGGQILRAIAAIPPGPFNLANWSVLATLDDVAGYMPLAGGTFTGVVIFPGNNSLVINGAAGSQRAILSQTAGANRWQMMLGDGSAETGLSAGSNFSLTALSDLGAILSTPLSINRATAAVTIAGRAGVGSTSPTIILNESPTASGNLIQGQRNGLLRWQMELGDYLGESTGNAGSNFRLDRYSDAGAQLAPSPLLIARATGVATFGAIPSIPGGVAGDALKTDGAGNLSWGAGGGVTVSDTPPAAPNPGDLWFDSVGGQTYLWFVDPTTSQWVPTTNQMGGGYLPLTGGVLSGQLNVPALAGPAGASPPVAAASPPVADNSLDLATTSWAQVNVKYGDNRIINGDMSIDQYQNGASGTSGNNVFPVDRWKYTSTGGAGTQITWGRNLNSVPVINAGFPYYLGFQVNAAYNAAAADMFTVRQVIEAGVIGDFAFGTANAQPVNLSFLVRSSLTGLFSGSLCNGVFNRSYPFTFSIPTANTWTKVTVTIPGDTAGTWIFTGVLGGAAVVFDLGSGSALRAPAGAWVGTFAPAATGAVSLVATAGATFYLTGVKLEVGSVATPFNRQSLAKSMADCERYYIALRGQTIATSYGAAGIAFSNPFIFPTTMRAVPTVVQANVGSVVNCSTITFPNITTHSVSMGATITAAGPASLIADILCTAEL